MTSDALTIFTGNANPALAEAVAKQMKLQLGKAFVGRFSDGEIQVEIQENVRGKNVVVIQSTCVPTNDNLMELMIMIDALKRASANRITAVIPYFGYARQDRRPRSARVAISARIVANMLQSVAGVERVLTMDLHADQIQGFFDIPVDNIYASPVLLGDLRAKNQADLRSYLNNFDCGSSTIRLTNNHLTLIFDAWDHNLLANWLSAQDIKETTVFLGGC